MDFPAFHNTSYIIFIRGNLAPHFFAARFRTPPLPVLCMQRSIFLPSPYVACFFLFGWSYGCRAAFRVDLYVFLCSLRPLTVTRSHIGPFPDHRNSLLADPATVWLKEN